MFNKIVHSFKCYHLLSVILIVFMTDGNEGVKAGNVNCCMSDDEVATLQNSCQTRGYIKELNGFYKTLYCPTCKKENGHEPERVKSALAKLSGTTIPDYVKIRDNRMEKLIGIRFQADNVDTYYYRYHANSWTQESNFTLYP